MSFIKSRKYCTKIHTFGEIMSLSNTDFKMHVPFEGPASIEKWAEVRGHSMTATHVYRDHFFQNPAEFECLIIMGGPMNIDKHVRNILI